MAEYIWLLLSGLYYSFSYAFIGLCAGVVLVLLLRKFKLFERQKKAMRIFVKFYYFLIPFAFMMTAWLCGSVMYIEGKFEDATEVVLQDLKHEYYPPLAHLINHEVKLLVASGQIPTNEDIIEMLFAQEGNPEESGIMRYTIELSISSLLDYLLGASHEREQVIGSRVGDLSTQMGDKLFESVQTMVLSQIRSITASMLIPILLIFFLAMLIPTIEIGISMYLQKRRLAAEAASQTPT